MDQFLISDYLENFVKETRRGTCKVCGKLVPWNRDKLSAHKRANCDGVSAQEKQIFSNTKRPRTEAGPSTLDVDEDKAEPYVLTEEKKAEIDEKISKLFFRTGMSFRIIDAPVFREVVAALNPAYAKVMPHASTLGGKLLDKEYDKSKAKLQEILENHTDLTLVTDGWTDTCGHHIVNYAVKAPSQPSVFYKSIDTTGVTQDAEGIADAIGKVLEELGASKFVALVTDNANVMKATWPLIEEKYPKISAYGCAAHCLNLLIKDILVPHDSGKRKKCDEY